MFQVASYWMSFLFRVAVFYFELLTIVLVINAYSDRSFDIFGVVVPPLIYAVLLGIFFIAPSYMIATFSRWKNTRIMGVGLEDVLFLTLYIAMYALLFWWSLSSGISIGDSQGTVILDGQLIRPTPFFANFAALVSLALLYVVLKNLLFKYFIREFH